MKRLYPLLIGAMFFALLSLEVRAQGCSISATTNLHGYGCPDGDEFDSFELNGTPANDAGCSNNNYQLFTSPVWNLIIGQSYTWAATVGGPNQYDQGMAIWIDLNNDGLFDSSEQLANEAPAINQGGTITIPTSATAASNVRMRLRCDYYTYLGNTNQTACETYGAPNYNFYYGETEDYYVNLIAPIPCTGTPVSNSAVTSTAPICPNSSAYLSLATSYTVMDITYQWQSSTTSSLTGWSSVSGATNAAYSTPGLTQNTWYQAIVACSNSGQSITATPVQVQVQGITTSSVPYYESFEGITANNKLPNCSWDATNLGTEAFTYVQSGTDGRIPRTGSKFASFYYYPSGTRNFYTNGIYLNAGVTYSASVWYRTEYYGYNNWTNLSIVAGPSQSAPNQFTIATVAPAIGNVYKPLSNTFTVATSGIYYVNIKATASTNAYAYYLSWDDLSIIVPCELNTPVLGISPSQTVCSGKPVTISATGLDTYTWSTGANGSVLTDVPLSNYTYSVTGTSTLSGCVYQLSSPVQVLPTPQVGIFTNKSDVCDGQSAVLTAFGADNYIWSNNSTGIMTTVTPNATTNYTVYGSNAYGCQGEAVQTIVHHMPVQVSGDADNTLVCIGSPVQLTGSGVLSYQWTSPSYFNQSNPAIAYPNVTTAYTVTGTDANGCKSTDVVVVSTQDCTGLNEIRTGEGIKVFPNPNSGHFTVVVPAKAQICITDVTGRQVGAGEGTGNVDLNISELSNGIYCVKIRTDNATSVVRIVKE